MSKNPSVPVRLNVEDRAKLNAIIAHYRSKTPLPVSTSDVMRIALRTLADALGV